MRLPIFAIDPGPAESGWVFIDEEGCVSGGVLLNENVLVMLGNQPRSTGVAIEMIASYGMPVGSEVFETCVWIGRMIAATTGFALPTMVYRKEVTHHLCGTAKGKDANVRQALIDMFPRTGGGKCPQIGTKKKPGPLFGFNSHMWPALGVAITARDTK